jgi:hypothetical protein
MEMKHFTSTFRSPAFWVIAVASGLAAIANWAPDGNQQVNIRADEPLKNSEEDRKKLLLREGTQLDDVKGRFTQSGDRTLFIEEGTNRSTKCLENLWLQRIVSSQKSDRKVTWQVTGKVTEFEGENFLIIEVASKNR